MGLPTYAVGTVTILNGATTVVGVGTIWSGINAREGDWIAINGLDPVLVTEVTDTSHIEIPEWTQSSQSAVPYIIYQNYVGRVVGVAAAEDVADLINLYSTIVSLTNDNTISGIQHFTNTTEALGSGTSPAGYAARFDGGVEILKKLFVVGAVALSSTLSVTSSSANALAVGLNGATNPALQIDASTASSATGLKVKSAAAAGGLALSVISSGTNESVTLDAKGSGTITLNGTATGNVTTPRIVTITNATASSLSSNGALVVTGGVGIGGAVNIAGDVNIAGVFGASSNVNTFGVGGTSNVNPSYIRLNGSSAAVQPAIIEFQVNADSKWQMGLQVTSSLDFAWYRATSGVFAFRISNSDDSVSFNSPTASSSPSTGGVKIAGGLGVVGTIWAATIFATGDIGAQGKLYSNSATAGMGYDTGAGGTATAQATNKSTAVTLNKMTGTITMNAASLAANTAVSFTFNSTGIAATDFIDVQHESVGTIGAYFVTGRATGSGTAQITVRNLTAGSLGEAIVLRFFVQKSVNA